MLTSLTLTGLLFCTTPTYEAPAGEYVEARTAAVYAGACHFNGEYTTQGRRAVLGWSIERGVEAGVDLAGVRIVALVESTENLVEAGVPHVSTVHVSATGDRATAALGWLLREHGAFLGEVRATHEGVGLSVDVAGERFTLALPDRVELAGDAMADRACCKMPFNVWYDPFQDLSARLVGRADVFRVDDDELGVKLSRPDDNNVFFGRFGDA